MNMDKNDKSKRIHALAKAKTKRVVKQKENKIKRKLLNRFDKQGLVNI